MTPRKGIKVAGNVPYKGRRVVRVTMKDGKVYYIGNKEARELAELLFIVSS